MDLTRTLDFASATNPLREKQLGQNMNLTKQLPKAIPKIKVKYD